MDGVTPAGTQSTVSAAAQLGQPIELLVVGEAAPTKIPDGVSKVYHVPIGDKLAETVANAIKATTSADTSVVMGTSSKFGSTVIPRAAALLQVSPITDILEIHDDSKSFGRKRSTSEAIVFFRILTTFWRFRNLCTPHVCRQCDGKSRI